MQGLIMDYQLNVPAILRRAEHLFADRTVVSRLADGTWQQATVGEAVTRAKRLGVALRDLGLVDGDRVATLMWNHQAHLETYVGAPASGFVTHTLNLRLHADDNAYIASHGGARVLVVDRMLWPIASLFVERVGFDHVVAVGSGETPDGAIDYDELVGSAELSSFVDRDLDERLGAGMCYTSGTTGRPKGVVYSHRAIAIHALTISGGCGLRPDDVVLPVVPMFHANAWCFPFSCLLTGTHQVFPGPHLDPVSLLDAFEGQRVTISAGVPTIWLGILAALDAEPERWDLSHLRTMIVGGAAAPRALIAGFGERHGLTVMHGWGMTEMSPVGTVSGLPGHATGLTPDEDYSQRARQGPPLPFVEIRARGDEGLVPWDGMSLGELEVRGPSVASAYYEATDAADRWTADGWFRTGDIVVIHPDGYVEIQDRDKDLVKSGGEWISSVALENALMGHPAVAEAAVIAVPSERWGERPLGVVVVREGAAVTPDELRAHLEQLVAHFWLPERFEFVAEIPKTAVGKFKKTALREQFAAPLRTTDR